MLFNLTNLLYINNIFKVINLAILIMVRCPFKPERLPFSLRREWWAEEQLLVHPCDFTLIRPF